MESLKGIEATRRRATLAIVIVLANSPATSAMTVSFLLSIENNFFISFMLACVFINLVPERRRRDSNSRGLSPYSLSKRAHSTTMRRLRPGTGHVLLNLSDTISE